jgi:hypothetical protein
MTSKAIKRRPSSAQTEKSSEKRMETTISASVSEPLLENTPHEDKPKVRPVCPIHNFLVRVYCILIIPVSYLSEDI